MYLLAFLAVMSKFKKTSDTIDNCLNYSVLAIDLHFYKYKYSIFNKQTTNVEFYTVHRLIFATVNVSCICSHFCNNCLN